MHHISQDGNKAKKVGRLIAVWSDARNPHLQVPRLHTRKPKVAQREAMPKDRSSDASLLVGVAVQGGGRDGGEGLGGSPLKARW